MWWGLGGEEEGVCGREWAEWGWCGGGNGGEIEVKARDCEEAEIKKKKGKKVRGLIAPREREEGVERGGLLLQPASHLASLGFEWRLFDLLRGTPVSFPPQPYYVLCLLPLPPSQLPPSKDLLSIQTGGWVSQWPAQLQGRGALSYLDRPQMSSGAPRVQATASVKGCTIVSFYNNQCSR